MGILLVGFDGSDPSRRALDHAVRRARLGGDEVVLLNVIPASVAKSSLSGMMPAGLELPAPLARTFEENARQRLQDVVLQYAAQGVTLRAEVRAGEAVQAIVDAAHELRADEVVIGHKSYEKESLDLGPIAERLVKHLPATVTVVR